MEQKIKDLYNSHKVLFFLLLPLIALFLFHSLIMDLLIGSAHKLVTKTQEQDKKLTDEVNKANNEANTLKTQADDLQKNIDNRKPDDVPDDWNKKV